MQFLYGVAILVAIFLLFWFIHSVNEISDRLKAIQHDQSLLRHQVDDFLKRAK